MFSSSFKWVLLVCLSIAISSATVHPIFVGVIEIEHNAKDNTLEISCKLFTNDFENALRVHSNSKIDLLQPKYKPQMETLVNKYLQTHLKIWVEEKPVFMKYVGYEIVEEGIVSYFQVDHIATVKTITVQDNILYEMSPEQISLVHIIVGGNRKSTKMNNPDDKVTMQF